MRSPASASRSAQPLVEFAPDASGPRRRAADAGTVVGHMPDAAAEDAAGLALAAANAVTHARVRAVPAARALARSLGVELGALTGTGRGGLITLDDVMAVGLPARGSSSKMHPAPEPAAAARRTHRLRAAGRCRGAAQPAPRDGAEHGAFARQRHGVLGVRRCRSTSLARRQRLHHAGAARDRGRRAYRTGTERLVRRAIAESHAVRARRRRHRGGYHRRAAGAGDPPRRAAERRSSCAPSSIDSSALRASAPSSARSCATSPSCCPTSA